jgi:hypothetical protein
LEGQPNGKWRIVDRKDVVMPGPRWTKFAPCTVIVAVGLACLPIAQVAIAASGTYDGVYRGEGTRTRGDERTCGKDTYPVSYTIVNGQFNILWDPIHHVGINIQVQADGTVSGSQQYMVGRTGAQLRAAGHIVSNVLEFDLEGSFCSRHYHATKAS